ncbi:MAG TPA: Fmu (Sun) domain protein, partial [Flavisolibacter sp.]|nr:Fmu (Sun) domain protein [Flavisolibacter sp.]
VQEASSMFLEQAMVQCADLSRPLKVLDLCAAPGGKSTHLQSLLSERSLLVSNEVIKSRTPVLTDNIIKWGAANTVVTSNDPSAFEALQGFFDVMVVDAPCSGSGLFRKDEAAMEEWSLNNVQLCCQRQQRILADALPALAEEGLLVYSTCSYSKEEDEDICDWLAGEMEMEPLALKLPADWGIITSYSPLASAPGYRFYPHLLGGEGFFIACFRKKGKAGVIRTKPAKTEKAAARERSIILPWLATAEEIYKEGDEFFLLPPPVAAHYSVLKAVLNIRYAGVALGQIMKERLVPAHALALSRLLAAEVPFNDLGYDDAISYLQRKELNFNTSGKGWQLAGYKGCNLGWINVLPNRINNYYPKEIRILKQSNDRSFEK